MLPHSPHVSGWTDAFAAHGQNCPWIALIIQLISAHHPSVPRATPDSGWAGWKKPLQKQCLLSELFPLHLTVISGIFSSDRRGKKIETIRLIIASNPLIQLKGECQRKLFLPKKAPLKESTCHSSLFERSFFEWSRNAHTHSMALSQEDYRNILRPWSLQLGSG